ncbi:MAG: type II secretion system protein [Planctomycetes bacterium]|nr:type II secretion system protein [Planctomycetota bacterium]
MRSVNRSGTAARGFTLIELLIVIAIILALVAIIVPAYGDLLGRLRGVTCQGNLRKLQACFRMYTRDHGNQFPPMQAVGRPEPLVEEMARDAGLTLNDGLQAGGYHWSLVLWPYHRSLDTYTCPCDPASESPDDYVIAATRAATPFADAPPLSYGMNTLLFRSLPALRNLAKASWGIKGGDFTSNLTFTTLNDQKRRIPGLNSRILMFCGTRGFPVGNQSNVAWRDSGIAKRYEWHPSEGPGPFEDSPDHGSYYAFYDGRVEYRQEFPSRYEWAMDLK